GVSFAERSVKCLVAFGGVPAIPLERAINKQSPARMQPPRGARHQTPRGAPWRDVDDIRAEDSGEVAQRRGILRAQSPFQCAEIESPRRCHVLQFGMTAPGLDAFDI